MAPSSQRRRFPSIRVSRWRNSPKVRKIEDISILIDPPYGFPMDVFFAPMDYEQTEFIADDAHLTMNKKQSGNKIVLEAIYKPAKGEELRVRQTWMKGEKWWREFERYRGKHKELHAWIPDSYFVQQKQNERRRAVLNAKNPSGAPPKQRPQPGKKPTPLRDDERQLRNDPRLRVPLNRDMKAFTVEDMLRQLRAATHVDLTLAADGDPDKVAFGSLSLRGVPAWEVMMKLATCPAVAGRWEKDEAGYRLLGAPHDPTPVTSLTKSTRGWRHWTILAATNLLVLGVLLAVGLWRKKTERGVTLARPWRWWN